MSIRGEPILQAGTDITDNTFSNQYQRDGTVLARLPEFQEGIILYSETSTLLAAND